MLPAVGSLETAVKHEHYILFALIIREFDLAAFAVVHAEIGSGFNLFFYHTVPPGAKQHSFINAFL
jgi:hypothetical protein